VVNLWANGANESIGFTARDASKRPISLGWLNDTAWVDDKSIEYELTSPAPYVQLGSFVLGSMRIERDFQYSKGHLRPFTAPAFVVAEESLLVARIERLTRESRREALQLAFEADDYRTEGTLDLQHTCRAAVARRSELSHSQSAGGHSPGDCTPLG
jgi:hypothetical protein